MMTKVGWLARRIALSAGLLAVPMLLWTSGAVAQTADGKQIFLGQKCNLCHSVKSAGIEATMKVEKMKGPDLPVAGADKALVKSYLLQTAVKNGKKHPKKFTGTDEQLNALADWVAKPQ
jgi:mono/diheme cytochrome c family protein